MPSAQQIIKHPVTKAVLVAAVQAGVTAGIGHAAAKSR
jgi:hypothetical protein